MGLEEARAVTYPCNTAKKYADELSKVVSAVGNNFN